MASKGMKNPFNTKKRKVIGVVAGVFILLVILVIAFGSPSSKTVFKDMNEKMLQTKSVTVDQNLKATSSNGDGFSMKSQLYMDLSSSTELKAQGNYSVDLTASGSPMSIVADVIDVGGSKYARFSKLHSSDATIDASFSQMEAKVKNNWIKSRDGDSLKSFVDMPFTLVTSVLPTPLANLNDDQVKAVLAILQEKDMYTIGESSKVEIGGVNAYKYTIEYNKDTYKQVEKLITGYVSYFKAGEDSGSEITTLNVWVNISTQQIIKIEFKGTSSDTNMEGTLSFSAYNKGTNVTKPNDYSIESELLN